MCLGLHKISFHELIHGFPLTLKLQEDTIYTVRILHISKFSVPLLTIPFITLSGLMSIVYLLIK